MAYRYQVLVFIVFNFFCFNLSWAQFLAIDSPFKSKIQTILQDSQGIIWVASTNSIARFDGYQFKHIQLNPEQSQNAIQVLSMAFSNDNELLIATQNAGLLSYRLDAPALPQRVEVIQDETIFAIEKVGKNIWLASQEGLYQLNPLGHKYYPYGETKLYVDAMVNHGNQLLFASSNKLTGFDIRNQTFTDHTYPSNDKTVNFWDLHIDQANNLLISTDQGVYMKNMISQEWSTANQSSSGLFVKTMVSDAKNLWLGTTDKGLIQNPSSKKHQIKHFSTTNSNLVSDTITSLLIDQDNNLWIGNYDGSMNLISSNALAFGLNTDTLNFSNCPKQQTFKNFTEDFQGNIWMTTRENVVKIDTKNKSCSTYELSQDVQTNKQKTPLPVVFLDKERNVWASYRHIGLVKIQDSDPTITAVDYPLPDPSLFIRSLITQTDAQTFVFGTSKGLVAYDVEKKELSPVKSEPSYLQQSIIRDAYQTTDNEFLIATNQGMASFDGSTLRGMHGIQAQLNTKRIQTVLKDSSGNTWIGTNDAGLFKFNVTQELETQFINQPSWQNHKNINNLIEDGHNNLWMSAETHLIRLNTDTHQVEIFDGYDGLQGKLFSSNSSFLSSTGKLYLAGLNGYNAFYPDDIIINQTTPSIVLTRLSRFNETIQAGINYAGFKIDQPINLTKELIFSYKDYVMALEFAALDYRAPKQNQYAYQLEGFDPDWNYVDANNRKATYTDLPSGQYTFKVKGSNKYGVWSETGRSISIKVKPAPWLSWWAFLSYGLMLVFMVAFYINKKIRDSKKQAALLKIEVENKTQELQLQKRRVESLLVKKNELFSNVSHEFRTPLTLILGPLKELIEQGHAAKDMASLTVINRNANRLLSLVEQLLQLARVSDAEKVHKSTQETKNQVESIVDSFQHMASNKKLKLSLLNNDAARIHVTDQCLDAILGNLISNAIKYTQTGGAVSISAQTTADALVLKVKDSGAGLSETQQKDIFKRFKRLDSHQAIEGIGIGLTVVEEVVKINQGHIEVNSEVGVGSEFVVTLPLSDAMDVNSSQSNQSLIKQLASESPRADVIADNHEAHNNNQLNQVLVIEDNRDMRQHIVEIIQPHYNILTAAHGKAGVALAIEHIPDLIICDVMMPEMDGFKVSRIIRSDERTSHIPLVLLTALNDKTSRIKGWREHVDAYMTKPFDRDELLVQLENMLTIRDILKKKTGQNILTNQDKAGNEHIALPQKDQQFINKLMQLIEEQYADPLLTLAKLADNMAVSDRQLQRKLKALTDQNPMDLLREFRLKKASELLKEGYQVSQIADNCGFNSLSYFSSCFKAQYGMPPKKYQQTMAS